MNKELLLEQQPNSDKMPIGIPSAQMPQNPLLVAGVGSLVKFKIYNNDKSK